jgi:calcineurin-like phosphoesterase family protein
VVRFIGDVHGKFGRYKRLIADCERSIQVGDMGVGFRRPDGSFYANPPYDAMLRGDHRFIRGNHDNPNVCREHSQWIPDGTLSNGTIFIGGGLSVDRRMRTEGLDWWPDEELSIQALTLMVSRYDDVRPHTMVTHDCPESIADHVMARVHRTKFHDPSRTRQAFQSMLEMHRPRLWIFGHWHHSFDSVIDGTRFICLAELETRDIEVRDSA